LYVYFAIPNWLPMTETSDSPTLKATLACVDVGGGGIQTTVFVNGQVDLVEGPHQPDGSVLLISVPGLIEGGRVIAASNLGWEDVEPVSALGLSGPASLVMNDAEAAALGEAALRGPSALDSLVYIGMGTGVGGAVVADGRVTAENLFGHSLGFSEMTCRCGQTGCLETVAGGWALPEPIDVDQLLKAARAVARAVGEEPIAADGVIVVGGGIARSHPEIVDLMQTELTNRKVEPSAAPTGSKSAAAWGLRHLFNRNGSYQEPAEKGSVSE
jgi:predicted NBD/HSP70 family sugar kinase